MQRLTQQICGSTIAPLHRSSQSHLVTIEKMTDTNKLLNPDVVKSNLILSSLYLTAYELLKDAIIDNLRGFFSFDYKDGKAVPDEQYKDQVTRAHKDLMHASCLWLQYNGVITESDVEEIENIRKHRNQIAHELPKLLVDADLNLNVGYLVQIRELLEKIEVWWVKNVHIPTNPDFDDVEVNEKDIHPGRVVVLDYITAIISSDNSQPDNSDYDK